MEEITTWHAGAIEISLMRPVIMGILNVTPDSFYDGGRYALSDEACQHAEEMLREGTDIIDVGGESSRPGSQPVDTEEELQRVIPVIKWITSELDAVVSVDTSKAVVASEALDAGACIVNDISGLRDPGMTGILRGSGAGYVLMHMHGEPRTMQQEPLTATDVMDAVMDFFSERLAFCEQKGINLSTVVIDPGIGFGKTFDANEVLLARLGEFTTLKRPVLIGVSRKRFIGERTGRDADDRLAGSLAAHVIAYMNGAHIIRTHDVRATRDALAVAEAVRNAGS
jgi:dihydropteroate synthase